VATETTIQVSNPWPEATLFLSVLNIHGQEIRKLAEGQIEPGISQYTWDASDHRGIKVVPGIYLLKLQAKNEVRTMKLQVMD